MVHRKALYVVWIALCLLTLPGYTAARAQDAPTAQTIAAILNVREGPGEDYPIIGELPYDTRVALEARSPESAWVRVQATEPALTGWVAADYLVANGGFDLASLPVDGEAAAAQPPPASGDAPASSGAVTTTALNMREGPGEDYAVIAVLDRGAALAVEATSADGYWAQVSATDGAQGWVSTCCLAVPVTSAGPDPAAWLHELGVITNITPRAREIYLQGLAMGNDPRAFSKFGDCNSLLPFFLGMFDRGDYNLGPYVYLQPAIDYFAGSFGRESLTAWSGARSWMMFDPTWANPTHCEPGETPIACELRINNPGVILVRFGTNEMGHTALFDENLRAIVEYTIERGVLPILGTKADSLEGANDANNNVIRQVALDYGVPLWDWGRAAETLPHNGLGPDGIHLAWVPLDFNYTPALETGQPLHNLTALIALDAVLNGVMY
jgi:uncharacterized protein YraI